MGIHQTEMQHIFLSCLKCRNASQISLIAAEVGDVIEAAPVEIQLELFDALDDGCQEAVKGEDSESKGALLDFFGVPVKDNDLLSHLQEFQYLAKRISRYQDPISQCQRLWLDCPGIGHCYLLVDDARLLLGVHYHGFGN